MSEPDQTEHRQDPGPSHHGQQNQDHQTYADLARRQEFLELKRRYTAFAFPATLAFMVWYLTYVICNNWARGFMNTPVFGNINIAVVFGLLQFVSTFLIAFLYSRHANRALDPLATQLREDFESRGQR